MWVRSELKDHAKEILKLSYWKAVLVSLILAVISGGSASSTSTSSFNFGDNYQNYNYSGSSGYNYPNFNFLTFTLVTWVILLLVFGVVMCLSIVFSSFLLAPLEVGAQRYFVRSLQEPSSLSELGFAFSNSYLNVVKTMFLRMLYIFLWSLLFLIPGIIKSYEYRMIPYILSEDPKLSTKEVFSRSRAMMDGEKWNTFVLDLSFLGWNILNIFTCFLLAIFYINPYYNLTCAELYSVLKQKVDSAPVSFQAASPSDSFYDNPYHNK